MARTCLPGIKCVRACVNAQLLQFSSVHFSRSVVSDSATPWIAARQASLSITISRSSLKLTSIESVMPSSHLILCRPLFLLLLPPSIRVFSNESTLRMRWPKYWSLSFSIIPSKEHPGLISLVLIKDATNIHLKKRFILLVLSPFLLKWNRGTERFYNFPSSYQGAESGFKPGPRAALQPGSSSSQMP